MKVILCGYHWAGCMALKKLIDKNHDVFVYTHESPAHIPSLIEYCEKLDIPFSLEKISVENLPFKPDIICSIYYRYIIPKTVVEKNEFKIINLHPSLLPNYRGCSSLTWAMINGDKKVGFTYHYVSESIDMGNIITQVSLDVYDFDTQQTLYNRVMFEALKELMPTIDKVLKGDKGYSVNYEGSLYYKRGCPYDGKINLNWDEEMIERFIRAMNYPPYPYAQFADKEIKTYKEFKSIISRREK